MLQAPTGTNKQTNKQINKQTDKQINKDVAEGGELTEGKDDTGGDLLCSPLTFL